MKNKIQAKSIFVNVSGGVLVALVVVLAAAAVVYVVAVDGPSPGAVEQSHPTPDLETIEVRA